jgi:hypothetical protein
MYYYSTLLILLVVSIASATVTARHMELDDNHAKVKEVDSVELLESPSEFPTLSFAPSQTIAPDPTNAPVPTGAPVPTNRPSYPPTAVPTVITFTGSGSVKYLLIPTVWNVQLTIQSAYSSYNLPYLTTQLLADTFKNFLDAPSSSLVYTSTELIYQGDLSWTLNLYYNLFVPLTGSLASYVNNPIEFYKDLKANFSSYSSSVSYCCLPTSVTTYYMNAGANYNQSIARTFIFQTIDFGAVTGLLLDPTTPPTVQPSHKPRRTHKPTLTQTTAPVPTNRPTAVPTVITFTGSGSVKYLLISTE